MKRMFDERADGGGPRGKPRKKMQAADLDTSTTSVKDAAHTLDTLDWARSNTQSTWVSIHL